VPKAEVVVGPTGRVRVDFAYVAERLVLEFNGAVAHASGAQQRHDYQRDNVLNRDGWTVLKFDWHRVQDDPEGVAREIRETYTAAHNRLSRAAASAPAKRAVGGWSPPPRTRAPGRGSRAVEAAPASR
jgi:Protein of unknown function (DUF559)